MRISLCLSFIVLLCFLGSMSIVFTKFRKFLDIISSHIFYFSSSLYGSVITHMIDNLVLFHMLLRPCSFYFHLFLLLCFGVDNSFALFLHLQMFSSAVSKLLLSPSSDIFILDIVFLCPRSSLVFFIVSIFKFYLFSFML